MSTQEIIVNAESGPPEAPRNPEALDGYSTLMRRLEHALNHVHTRRAALTLADQIAVSGTNFVTTILLGRFCLQEELGVYALGFSLVLLLGGAANALIWMPYTFNSPHDRSSRIASFTGSVTVHMALFCILTALGLGMAATVMGWRGGQPELSGLLVVLAVAGTLMLFREYMRRVYLAQMRAGCAFLLNLAMAGMQLAGLAMIARRGVLSSHSAYWVIASAGGLLTIAWFVVERHHLTICWQAILPDWRRNWKTGRWMFAANLIQLVATDLYPWILAVFHGVHAVAILAAARGVIVFANPLLLGMNNFAGPFAAHAHADHGPRGVWQRVLWSTLAMGAVMGLFCAMVSIWGGDLVQLLYGPQYSGQGRAVQALAFGQLIEAMGIPVSFGLLAVHRADYELVTAVVQLLVMLSLGLWLVWHFGPVGVGYGYALSYLVAGAIRWSAFRRIVHHA